MKIVKFIIPTAIFGMLPVLAKPKWDCQKLKGTPQEDVRWDFETAVEAKCKARRGVMQHWEITIPNDKIFDHDKILNKGESACGSAIYEAIDGGRCGKGHRSCTLGSDGVARLVFTCGAATGVKVINDAFHEATCDAFPEVQCYKE